MRVAAFSSTPRQPSSTEVDYAMLIKMYEGDSGKDGTARWHYSPAVCTGSREQTITAALDRLGPGLTRPIPTTTLAAAI